MKTIKTQKINGIEIVVGFDDLKIDPVASRKERARLFAESAVWQEAEPKLKRLRRQATELHNARKQLKHLEVERLEPIVENLAEEIKGMKEQLDEARQQAHVDGTMRFCLRPGEHEASDELLEEIDTELRKLKPNQYLTLDGKIIEHLAGLKYWRKTQNGWEWKEPKFGEKLPAAWAPAYELNPVEQKEIEEQLERNRISGLSVEAKESEFLQIKNRLLENAAKQRSMLEITGEENALEKSQEWYKSELDKLEKRYQ